MRMKRSIFPKVKKCSILAGILCMALLITVIPIRSSAADEQTSGSTHANLVLFAYFSDETETDWFNETSSSAYTDDYTKDMTNVQRFMQYYDGSRNRSFSTYMSKISGGTYKVKNVFPQYNETTGKVEPLKLSVTEADARAKDCDSQIVSELEKAIDLSQWKDQLDLDGDTVIDNVSVVLQGEDGSVAGTTMRSHKFTTYSISSWNGAGLSAYTFNMLNTTALNNKRAGLISHEYLHSLNYPDLYRKTDSDYPVGNWDIMSSDGRFMTYPLAYLRMAISGWAQIPDIADIGNKTVNNDNSITYEVTLETISDTNLNNAVMITSPVNPYEKFVIEVREKPADYLDGDSLDGGIPKSGVIIYRVDTTVENFSNFYGKTGVYVFGSGSEKTREDAALDAGNPRYGNADLEDTSKAITYSNGANTGIVVSDVSDIQDGKVSLEVTVPDWSSLDAWKDTTGISNSQYVTLVDLNGTPTSVVQSSLWSKNVSFYKYADGQWTASDLQDLTDSQGIADAKLISFNGKIFASYVNGKGDGHVKVLEGSSWVDVVDSSGQAAISGISNSELDIGVAGNQLYVSYVTSYQTLYVREITVGDTLQLGEVQEVATATGNFVSAPRVLEQGEALVIAYKDDDTIKLVTGGGVALTSAGEASSYDVITYNKELYFVSASASELTVKKFNPDSTGWETIASDKIDSFSPKLAIAQGNLYVVTGPATSGKTGVYAYEVTEGQLALEGLTVDSGVRGSNYSMIASGDTLLIGYTAGRQAVIKEKTISNSLLSLTITPPDKVSYTVGEEMSLEGLKVTANYQNNTRELAEGEYTVTGFGTEENGKLIARAPGEQTATITLTSDSTIKNTFTFWVYEVPFTASITSVKNNGSEAREFVYGDKMDVTVETTGANGKAAALYYRAADGALVKLTDAVTITDENPPTISYDTTKKLLPTGENLSVEVCFVDGDTITNGDSVEISLAKKQLTASITGNLDKTYDGTTDAPSTAGLQLSGAINNEATLSGKIEYESPDAKAQTLSVKDFKVNYVQGTEAYYESPEAPTATGTISKATVSQTDSRYLTVQNNREYSYSYDLTQLLPSLSGVQIWGDVSYELQTVSLGNYYKDGAKIEDGELLLPIQAVNSSAENEIGTIEITVKSTNFQDFTAKLTVQSSNQKVPEGIPAIQGTLTYGQALSELGLTADMVDGDSQTAVAGTISWVDGSILPNAGKYQAEWRFVPDDNAYASITGTTEIEVARKPVTVTLNVEGSAAKTYDGTTALSDEAVITIAKIEGILDRDNVTVAGDQLTAVYEKADAGTKKIIVSGLALSGDDSALSNYELETTAVLETETGITPAAPQIAENITAGNLEAGKPLSGLSLSGSFTGVGNEVLDGTLSWKDPNATFKAGTYTAEWVFTPESANYMLLEGSVEITVVKKEDPTPDNPTADDPTHDNPTPGEKEPSSESIAASTDGTETDAVKTGDEANATNFAVLFVLSVLIIGICIYKIRLVNRKN